MVGSPWRASWCWHQLWFPGREPRRPSFQTLEAVIEKNNQWNVLTLQRLREAIMATEAALAFFSAQHQCSAEHGGRLGHRYSMLVAQLRGEQRRATNISSGVVYAYHVGDLVEGRVVGRCRCRCAAHLEKFAVKFKWALVRCLGTGRARAEPLQA